MPLTPASSRRYQSAARRRPAVQFIQHLELLAADGRLDLVEAEVVADFLVEVLVAFAPAVVLEHLDGFDDLRIIGGDRAAVAVDGEVLGGIEAERGELAHAAGVLALPLGAMGLGAILDDPQAVVGGQFHHRIHVGRPAVEVHRQDADGALGDLLASHPPDRSCRCRRYRRRRAWRRRGSSARWRGTR